MELFQASNQWQNRPADQRFASLDALYNSTFDYFNKRSEKEVQLKALKVEPSPSGELMLTGENNAARFTHHGFGQFCSLMKYTQTVTPPGEEPSTVSAPAGYLRACPPQLAALNLNFGILQSAADRKLQMLFHREDNGGLLVRAATGTVYSRYWNWNVAKFLQSLPRGWRVPPARPSSNSDPKTIRKATQSDLIDAGKFGLSIRLGDDIAPAGIYASDHDMFVFMVNEDQMLRNQPGNPGGLARGFFVTNDEVGSGSLRFTCFLYDTVCGNHIVWGAQKVMEVRLRHVGQSLQSRVIDATHEMVKFSGRSAQVDEALIQSARTKLLGSTKDQVIEMVNDKHGWVPKKRAEEAYAMAEKYVQHHGDPRSAWGFMSGLTRLSQQTTYADQRDTLDRAARKVLEYAF